jgi:hypothetical protein
MRTASPSPHQKINYGYLIPSTCHAIKPWGKNDKDKLQKLIENSKVDTSKMGDIDYINLPQVLP